MCDGIGTDIVSVPRIAALVEREGSAFTQRWFTPLEIAYCTAKAVPSRHFAARLAAKEAVVKALPFEWEGPVPWRSVEVVNEPTGAPVVRLSGDLLAAATRAGVGQIRVSMSHCDEFATATATVAVTVAVTAEPVDRAPIEQVLREWQALRDETAGPELEAVRLAILLEDVFGVALSDDDIDLSVLSDPDAVSRLLAKAGPMQLRRTGPAKALSRRETAV